MAASDSCRGTVASSPPPAWRSVSADAANWIAKVVAERCPNAVRCADPFHLVAWHGRLGCGSRDVWNSADGRRRGPQRGNNKGSVGQAKQFKRGRWPLWKNPENLTPHQREQLEWTVKTGPLLHRAYLQRACSTCSRAKARKANKPSTDG